jgi:predicted DsbA family dithiol-disulfide isomerase
LPPEYAAAIQAKRPHFEAVARQTYGLEINAGPFGISSRPALVGSKYAQTMDVSEAYHAAVLKAYWQEARSIDQTGVLAGIATSIGLDEDPFLAALESPEYHEAVQLDVDQAQRYGLRGVPALILVDKYLLSGAYPYDVLCQTIEEIQAKEALT